MHMVQAKTILSQKNGMNVYRGCTHGCIYCDARSTCYQMKHEFTDIEVKENAAELLETALRKKRHKCMIGTGAMCDPYLQIEEQLQITKRCLELVDEYGFGLYIQTKSDLILRDLDLLKRIHQKTKCVVAMTLTTYDEELCRIVEPNVCTTKRRAEVLRILRDEGIPTICWMTPILPFINDTMENLQGLLDYLLEAKVYGILLWDFGVTLREGDREYFYQKLDQHFPGMKQRYIKTYGNSYGLVSPNNAQLMNYLKSVCEKHHIVYDIEALFSYMQKFEDKRAGVQMSLSDFL